MMNHKKHAHNGEDIIKRGRKRKKIIYISR